MYEKSAYSIVVRLSQFRTECINYKNSQTQCLYIHVITSKTLQIGQVNYGKISIHKKHCFSTPTRTGVLLNLTDKTIYQSLLTENFQQYKHVTPEKQQINSLRS